VIKTISGLGSRATPKTVLHKIARQSPRAEAANEIFPGDSELESLAATVDPSFLQLFNLH
jgi:hypothetical protein